MTRRWLVLGVFVVLALGLTGCDGLLLGISLIHPAAREVVQSADHTAQITQPPSDSVMSLESIEASLQAVGAEVTRRGSVTQPFFQVIGQIITVNGEDIQVFEFANEAAAEDAAAQISPDGSSTRTTVISWVADPHFYQMEGVIVLYVGDNSELISMLNEMLGMQFAGR